jgi:hypothetical protein
MRSRKGEEIYDDFCLTFQGRIYNLEYPNHVSFSDDAAHSRENEKHCPAPPPPECGKWRRLVLIGNIELLKSVYSPETESC